MTTIDGIANTAHAVCEAIRETDPHEVLSELATQCEADPIRMAQVIMALAAWVPVDEPLTVRWARVEEITRTRLKVA